MNHSYYELRFLIFENNGPFKQFAEIIALVSSVPDYNSMAGASLS